MPKMICTCGHWFNLGEIPSNEQWMIISDNDYDKFSGNVDAEEIYKEMKIMLKCSICGRLSVFWEGFRAPASVYSLDL